MSIFPKGDSVVGKRRIELRNARKRVNRRRYDWGRRARKEERRRMAIMNE